MAVIDFVKWDAQQDDLVWRHPSQELSTWTQLIVNETQEAYLVREGVYQGPYGAGRHTLSTENIPLLRSAIGIPFGGKSPFTAEVWFVNKLTNLSLRWGTTDPIQIQDPAYGILVPLRAFGTYGVRVDDTKKLLLKLVGTLKRFDSTSLADYFRGVFITKIKTSIASVVLKQGRSVLELSAELEMLSEQIRDKLEVDMSTYGLTLEQFNVNSISVPEDDSAVQKLRNALASRAEMKILNTSYQQARSFDVLQDAAQNQGGAGGVMGAGIGMGMGVGIGGVIGNQVATMVQPVTTNINQSDVGLGPCSSCGATLPQGSKFCPKCADPVFLCTRCSADNKPGDSICVRCGAMLPQKCINCSQMLPENSKFCSSCGTSQSFKCSGCNASISKGLKFCPECGVPQQVNQ